VQQVEYRNRTERRVRRADGSGPLPQFDIGAWEAFDPDRTLERLPRISLTPAPATTRPRVSARRAPEPPVSEADLASTVEIVPEEISEADFLDALSTSELEEIDIEIEEPVTVPAPRTVTAAAAAPALAAPSSEEVIPTPPVSVPLDLDRLLARAHTEARKSPDFFRAAAPPRAPTASDFLAADPAPMRAEPYAIPLALHHPRRRLGWVVATVTAITLTTLCVAIGQSTPSAAGSQRGFSVKRTTAAASHEGAQDETSVATGWQGASAPSTNEATAVPVQNLPRVASGTISLAAVAASHRLFVDGRVAEGASATVTCGRHLVQVGSRGARRYVNVPCGQEIVLAN
jgi:hypothetical protein